ncbi:NupC/NupG family nucleoside CNT transporter [Atopobacter phocae]|uniref:NupC/NupG family nucleoside CNT transporter n=1 Tax=Atopobacter phocae TaxID=136492 RepID=UPI0004AE1228|nr:nucleoside transporter C-terminal domain-containing protein [Atopobacter phocae]
MIINILRGVLGIVTVLVLAYLLSFDRKRLNFRTIGAALSIQIIFAFLALKSSVGQAVMLGMSDGLSGVVGYANEGISFLFGPLVEGGFVFAIQVLTVIVFFSSLISVLYYIGIMQRVIDIIGGGLSKLLQTTRVESLSAAANIFLGLTEAPLVVKPYLSKISDSEIFAIMVGGFGSVSGTVLVGYSLLGIPLKYLLAASFMSAPAALLLSKIVYPLPKEALDKIKTGQDNVKIQMDQENQPTNIIDAAARGASTGVGMAIQIGGILFAFISLIALVNGVLGNLGDLVGLNNLTLERILGFILSPVAFLIGVPWKESMVAAQFLGQKMVINEFVAYVNVGKIADELSPKTLMLLSFSLAGFANFGAIASQIGGLGELAPTRRAVVSKLGLRAMLVGMLVSLLNASIAGMFI